LIQTYTLYKVSKFKSRSPTT